MALNLQSIYVLASGSSRAMEQLDTISNNLANVNTSGFKKLLLKEMSQRIEKNGGDSNHLFVFPRFEETPVVDIQGSLKISDNPLDFAIEGKGFFVIESKGGQYLTRNGHFFIDSEGYLVDSKGNYVLDSNDKKIFLDHKKSVSVGEDGVIYQEQQEIAKLKIVANDKIEAVGDNYYKGIGNEIEAEYKILQGYIESSNVNPIKEMTEMITTQRRFDIYGNLIKSLDMLEQKSNEIGKA